METTIALFGAAGKMGTRIVDKLEDDSQYRMLYVEAGEIGRARLRERGLEATSGEEAARRADLVILAVPDVVLGKVAAGVVPALRSGGMVICLDPAAPYSGDLPERRDITYFITHPCHPPVISDEVDPAARMDFFGGVAKQNVVCALMQGPEEDYARGEQIVRRMFAPVMNAHRITVEQMAILEPAMAETVVLTCMAVMREAMEEAIRRGVPAQAARDFMLGHMNVNLGILFDFIDAEVSDGAKLAMQRGMEQIFQADWKKVFEPQDVLRQVKAITQAR
jgi:3-hydroxyisobutyrate dehydrogenase-like beta-hydroxyacid dehydrogenase